MAAGRGERGFTLVEIVVVVGVVSSLAAIAVPNFMHARDAARSSACVNNLRLLDAAKEQMAAELGLGTGAATTSSDLTPYLKGGAFPRCPATTAAYATNSIGFYPTCALSGAAAGAVPKSHRLD